MGVYNLRLYTVYLNAYVKAYIHLHGIGKAYGTAAEPDGGLCNIPGAVAVIRRLHRNGNGNESLCGMGIAALIAERHRKRECGGKRRTAAGVLIFGKGDIAANRNVSYGIRGHENARQRRKRQTVALTGRMRFALGYNLLHEKTAGRLGHRQRAFTALRALAMVKMLQEYHAPFGVEDKSLPRVSYSGIPLSVTRTMLPAASYSVHWSNFDLCHRRLIDRITDALVPVEWVPIL